MPLPAPTPPALHCRHFIASPMCRPLPAKPAISPFSATWVAEQAQPGSAPRIATFHVVGEPQAGDRDDQGLPLYRDPGSAAGIVHVLRCSGVDYSAFTCGRGHMEGAHVRLPSGAFPQGGSDHHLSVDDDVAGREVDLWGAETPDDVANSTLHVLTAGQCAYDGDGTRCSGATATNIATSLGAIDPVQLAAVAAQPHGSLPYAIATTLLCASPTWVYPADYSDGANTDQTPACRDHLGRNGRPPEGVRYFLDLSDTEIDATSNPPYVKAILRTLDREHYGGTVTDTNWPGAPGPALQFLRAGWLPITRALGLAPYQRATVEPAGIDLVESMRFCTNGTC